MSEKGWTKLTLTVCVITLISFWVVVIVGGLYINRAITTINNAQTQIESAVDSLEEIDIKDINKTVESLQEAGDALQGLISIVAGGEDN